MKKFEFSTSIFKAYDIRGIIPSQLNEEVAYFLGLCIGLKSNSTIVVGMDARASSPILQKELIKGIIDAGTSVVNIGVVSTPMCYFAVQHLSLQTSIMITGSHNPITYNGFKVILNGKSAGKDELLPIIELAKNGIEISKTKGEVVSKSVYEAYFLQSMQSLNFGNKKLKIGIDAMNGSGGEMLKQICSKLPFEFIVKNADMSGDFEAIQPEPSSPKNVLLLKEFLVENNLDFAFSFDGDADRVLMATKDKIFYGDDITLLLAHIILPSNQGRKVIFDVKSSITLEAEIQKLGGIPIIFKTGHSLIKQKLKEENAILAGEMSGHIYINDGKFFPFDDGIYSFLRILEYISHSSLPTFEETIKTPEIKIHTPNREEFMAKIKALVMQKNPSRVIEIDGIKAYFKNNTAAILARPSNTEEVIVARVEAKDRETFEELQALLSSLS